MFNRFPVPARWEDDRRGFYNPFRSKIMTYPPIKNGTRVKVTTRRSGNPDYTSSAIAARAFHDGKIGIVCEYHDSHGLCYGVKFEDGLAFFDPEELERV